MENKLTYKFAALASAGLAVLSSMLVNLASPWLTNAPEIPAELKK